MILEKLLNQPASEPELMYGLTAAIRVGFHDLGRRPGYFIKLDRIGEGVSKFSYVKGFDNFEQYEDFKWSSKYDRCGVSIRTREDHFYLLGFGFFYVFQVYVFADRIEFEDIHETKTEFEKIERPSRELVEAARRELGFCFAMAKRGQGAA